MEREGFAISRVEMLNVSTAQAKVDGIVGISKVNSLTGARVEKDLSLVEKQSIHSFLGYSLKCSRD